jgi:hypothetical protein
MRWGGEGKDEHLLCAWHGYILLNLPVRRIEPRVIKIADALSLRIIESYHN